MTKKVIKTLNHPASKQNLIKVFFFEKNFIDFPHV